MDGDGRTRVQAGSRGRGRATRKRGWFRWALLLVVGGVLFSVLQVLVLRFVDPPFSAFMAERQLSSWVHGDWSGIAYQWRDLGAISPSLPLAVVAAEDQNFPVHNGFDFKAIEKARASNLRGHKVRGASTISQQVAKNLFLWSGRSWVRKGIEAWYTVLIEAFWPKHRILEMYVNIAEFGDGVYGAQAASRTFFGINASQLSPAQSARLAAVLPSPLRYDAGRPGPYVQRRTHGIQRQMRHLGPKGDLP
jgi:monofunctional biosynthetic peptidoglycan transglycosylase